MLSAFAGDVEGLPIQMLSSYAADVEGLPIQMLPKCVTLQLLCRCFQMSLKLLCWCPGWSCMWALSKSRLGVKLVLLVLLYVVERAGKKLR